MWFAVFVGFRCLMLLIGWLAGEYRFVSAPNSTISEAHTCILTVSVIWRFLLLLLLFCYFVFWEKENMRARWTLNSHTVIQSLYRRTLSKNLMGNFVYLWLSRWEYIHPVNIGKNKHSHLLFSYRVMLFLCERVRPLIDWSNAAANSFIVHKCSSHNTHTHTHIYGWYAIFLYLFQFQFSNPVSLHIGVIYFIIIHSFLPLRSPFIRIFHFLCCRCSLKYYAQKWEKWKKKSSKK